MSVNSKTDEGIFGYIPTIKYYEAAEIKSIYWVTIFLRESRMD